MRYFILYVYNVNWKINSLSLSLSYQKVRQEVHCDFKRYAITSKSTSLCQKYITSESSNISHVFILRQCDNSPHLTSPPLTSPQSHHLSHNIGNLLIPRHNQSVITGVQVLAYNTMLLPEEQKNQSSNYPPQFNLRPVRHVLT